MRFLTLMLLLALWTGQSFAQSPSDGAVRGGPGGTTEAFDAEAGQWVPMVTFWLRYADRRGGLTWGRGDEYPPYADVDELDTFLVELDNGPCLMAFFHGRWRRANDIRRWDEAHNEHGGCPHVFE